MDKYALWRSLSDLLLPKQNCRRWSWLLSEDFVVHSTSCSAAVLCACCHWHFTVYLCWHYSSSRFVRQNQIRHCDCIVKFHCFFYHISLLLLRNSYKLLNRIVEEIAQNSASYLLVWLIYVSVFSLSPHVKSCLLLWFIMNFVDILWQINSIDQSLKYICWDIQKHPAYVVYGTQKFVTVFTRDCHWSLSWASWIHFISSNSASVWRMVTKTGFLCSHYQFTFLILKLHFLWTLKVFVDVLDIRFSCVS
jgi:hypothetical protein